MITKDNFKLYQSLFEQINSALGHTADADKISDIDDYFMELENIRKYVQGNGTATEPQNDPVFLILPLAPDEEIFEIRANSRKIIVPDSFATNGLGVQGDELAEIVYFSIDRYFDIIDLYDKEIFVQWEAPPAPGSPPNATGDRGLSVTINKTLSYEAGKVVFGWPITSDITKYPGNVKFAVRFYERGTDSDGKTILTYSFSTLNAMAKINPALDFIINDESQITAAIVNKNNLIYTNLRNSSAIGVDVPAVIPTFDLSNFTPDPTKEYDVGVTLSGRAYFTEGDDENGMGIISYSWERKDKENRIYLIEDNPKYMEVAADEKRNKNDVYFTLNSLTGKYEMYQGQLPADTGITVYKLYATHTPSEAGYYYLIAKNRAGQGNEELAKSDPWLIAFAKAPVFEYPTGKNVLMTQQEDGNYILAELKIDTAAPDHGQLTYQWQETVNNVLKDIPGATSNVLSNITKEGLYNLRVTNAKNNDTITVNSESIRVSQPPQPVTIAGYYVDDIQVDMNASAGYDLYLNGINHVVSVNASELLPSHDAISYQWYDDNGPIDGATDASYLVSATGYGVSIYVKITNKYNENYAYTTSSKFNIKR